jgi:predicted transcriptional regulator
MVWWRVPAMARGEPNRNLRVPDDLWDRALAVAHRRGETLSQVIRAALVRYVKRHEKDAP